MSVVHSRISARPGGIIGILESPHRGDSNEYTQYTIFNMKRKIALNYLKSATMRFFSKGLKNKFETVVVNEPSVFEPLKFYCTALSQY